MNECDNYVNSQSQWKEGLNALRALVTGFNLQESLKWGRPCYTLDGRPVIGLAGFKNHFGIWFFHGALLSDPEQILVNAQEGKTRAMRHLRFDSLDALRKCPVRDYIDEAVRNAKNGLFVKPEKRSVVLPPRLKSALKGDAILKEAYDKFSEGNKREFAEYIAQAKRESTRDRRCEKVISLIKKGEALNDKYR